MPGAAVKDTRPLICLTTRPSTQYSCKQTLNTVYRNISTGSSYNSIHAETHGTSH